MLIQTEEASRVLLVLNRLGSAVYAVLRIMHVFVMVRHGCHGLSVCLSS